MGAEQQQGTWYQASLFGGVLDDVRHDTCGEGGTGAAVYEERQTLTASERERALTSDLMSQVCERDNLNRAYKGVKANKGAPGVDGMTVNDLYAWLVQHKETLIASLLDGSYQPQAVRGVEIPKVGGSGKRQLGIPMRRSHCTSMQWDSESGRDACLSRPV